MPMQHKAAKLVKFYLRRLQEAVEFSYRTKHLTKEVECKSLLLEFKIYRWVNQNHFVTMTIPLTWNHWSQKSATENLTYQFTPPVPNTFKKYWILCSYIYYKSYSTVLGRVPFLTYTWKANLWQNPKGEPACFCKLHLGPLRIY